MLKKGLLSIFILMLAMGTTFADSKTRNNKNNYSIIYFTSWGTEQVDLARLSKQTTHIILAFAKVDENFEAVATDAMLKYKKNQEAQDLSKIEKEYLNWTQYKYNNPNTKFLLAFGGATYGAMWEVLQDEKNVNKFVTALRKIVNEEYPVYVKTKNKGYEKVGYVKLDGIDLDFEATGRPTEQQLKSLANVISSFKKAEPNKIISLTGYHTSADPVSCQTAGTKEEGCSFPSGSVHSGELINLFKYLKVADLDFYNLMAYDADKNYDWKTAMANHAKYLGKNKVVLGLSLGSQWGEKATFQESMKDLLQKTREQKELGYAGIMVWAIGAVELKEINRNKQVDKINQIIATLNK